MPNNKLKKYVGVLVSLIVLITLFKPVINLMNSNNVITTISNVLDGIRDTANIKYNTYDYSNLKDRTIFGSVKENIEKELLTSCKEKFDSLNITKVEVELDDSYKLNKVKVKAKNLEYVANASEVIEYLEKEFGLEGTLIEVVGG